MRLVGYFDGKRYQSYQTMADFLEAQLSAENNGRWFFAHYGGMADVQFVLETLASNPRYHLSAIFAGSAAIQLVVRDVRKRRRWVFVDSFCLLRAKLSKIAEQLGTKKTGPTDDMDDYQRRCWYEDVPIDELTDYNEQDCRILYRALCEFEQRMLELGGQLRITIASCALDLFLRKYLKTDLPTNVSLNRWAGEAYISSRVEVLQKRVKRANYYDINSSFPFSGTKALPGKIHHIGNTLPDGVESLYIADCDIEVPEMHIPPLPMRAGGKIFFPTGKWRARFFSEDIRALETAGGRVIKCHDVIHLEPFGDDLARYFDDITARKQRSTGFEREQYKLLDNGLYGKFAERAEKQIVHINPSLKVLERLKARCDDGEKPDRHRMITPGIWVENVNRPLDHAHTAISMAITSYSRSLIWEWMTKARECYYVDTDGIAVHPDDQFPTGDGLGELKLEKIVVDGYFVQPKVYKMITDKGKTIYKAKGFSLGATEKERADRFEDLISHREVEIRHMSRIRENLADGCVVPWEEIRPKQIADEAIEKRCFDAQGRSRPWSTTEIEGMIGAG